MLKDRRPVRALAASRLLRRRDPGTGFSAINPNTRKPIQVPEKKLVKFSPGKALREAVNKK